MRPIRMVVLRRPLRIERGEAACTECPAQADDERHTTTVSECSAFRQPEGCPEPSAHHLYRAQPWWRRIRREAPWEGWL